MKREDLVALGISDDSVISKIMEINGRDIEHHKTTAEMFKTQLKNAQDTLKSFEGVDVSELQQQISKLNADLETQKNNYEAKIADNEFSSSLDSALTAAKAKNLKAVKALLDVDALKQSKNQTDDIKSAIAQCQKEYAYLFDTDKPQPQISDLNIPFKRQK